MLRRKFFRDGETPLAASATSGTTMDEVSAAAVSPATAFSFREALTSNLPAVLDPAGHALDVRRVSGLKKASAAGSLFWLAWIGDIAMDTAVVAAIGACLILLDWMWNEKLGVRILGIVRDEKGEECEVENGRGSQFPSDVAASARVCGGVDKTFTSASNRNSPVNIADLYFLRQKTVSNVELHKYFLELKHQSRSSFASLPRILEIDCVGHIKGHQHLVYIYNLLYLHAVTRAPVLRLTLQLVYIVELKNRENSLTAVDSEFWSNIQFHNDGKNFSSQTLISTDHDVLKFKKINRCQ
ncbi:CheY-like two-component responsive regulatorfamily protein [Striga asiatica]|uniref:CheY-like two-component responsive regulatorfamily protein n=1 Tax=Striga asiatica TaxID=4170 RepID=A0A5A7RID3_STRAF|nr:CheY-like two-component responsive regulatorfamily protein [Striga asiatica]